MCDFVVINVTFSTIFNDFTISTRYSYASLNLLKTKTLRQ